MTNTPANVSFEFFPPQSLDASFRLWDAVRMLAPLDPSFVSVTYGAGGSTRERTHEALASLTSHFGLNVAGHLTCVNASKAETLAIAQSYADAGVKEIVALRGDAPAGANGFVPREDGFSGSVELVAALAEMDRFHIRVGAYPDRHPEATSETSDIEMLKRKFDAGADSAITQYFFDVETYFRFLDKCEKAGINGPIIPGIFPIESWEKTKRFSARCNAKLPDWMDGAFANAARDNVEDLLSISICTEICSDLMEQGINDLHFYTLNRPTLTRRVCEALGVEPRAALRNVA